MKSETTIRVRYAETDQMGVAHHSAYVAWLELARVDWLSAAGLDYAAIEESGIFFPVVELGLQYKRPARFNDEVRVTCWLAELASRKFVMRYSLHIGEKEIATAFTTHVPQDGEGKARRLPAELMRRLERAR